MKDLTKRRNASLGGRLAKWSLYVVANAIVGFFLQRAILASGLLTPYADAAGGWIAQHFNFLVWIAAVMLSLFVTALLMFAIESVSSQEGTKGTSRASAIKVHPYLYADEVQAENEQGEEIADQRLVTLCLQVSNALGTGEVIRNAQATLVTVGGARYRLRIRGSETGMVDLRDGDLAFVEVAQLLSRPGRAPPGFSGPVRVNEGDLTTRVFHGFGSIRALVPNVNGAPGLLHYVNVGVAPGKVAVVLSADGVKSRTIWLRGDFFVPSAAGWSRPMIMSSRGYRMTND